MRATAEASLGSTDGGRTWRAARLGVGAREIDALVVDPQYPKNVYAGGISLGAVFRSTDGGGSWHRFGGSSTHLSVEALGIDSGRRQLYAGTESGVFEIRITS
jgi:photosystem II stability/assembly factor-like uncharacterized protein